VLGDHLATLARWLTPGIEQELDARLLSAKWDDGPVVLASALGAEAAMRGASALALQRVYDDPTVVAELGGKA
jgi:hypothetical protein